MITLAIAAAQPTALQKLQQIPAEFWLKIGLVVLGIVVTVILLRKLAQVNKVIAAVVVVVALTTVGISWIYNRNEPSWATPVVEKLAMFLPTKGAYATKQATNPKP